MKNEDLYIYKKSDFYEDYISSQKEYYERANADAYFAERLAEKDKLIAYAQALVLEDIKLIRHQKYKRCVAMADKCAKTAEKYYYLICLDGSNNPKYDRFPNKMDFWGRWRKRWLGLAEKFKEAK